MMYSDMLTKLESVPDLYQFAVDFINGKFAWLPCVPREGVICFGSVISLVLYREPPFQVELIITPYMDSGFTEHRHPDVDTIEYPLCGDGDIYVNGKPTVTPKQKKLWMAGKLPSCLVPILHQDWHYGQNSKPSAFISFQKWLNGVQPTSVGINWEGSPISDVHKELINNGV